MRLGGQFEIGPTFLFGSGYAGLGISQLLWDTCYGPVQNPTLSAILWFACRWLAMNIRSYLDPSTGQPYIYKHGASEREVIAKHQG